MKRCERCGTPAERHVTRTTEGDEMWCQVCLDSAPFVDEDGHPASPPAESIEVFSDERRGQQFEEAKSEARMCSLIVTTFKVMEADKAFTLASPSPAVTAEPQDFGALDRFIPADAPIRQGEESKCPKHFYELDGPCTCAPAVTERGEPKEELRDMPEEEQEKWMDRHLKESASPEGEQDE